MAETKPGGCGTMAQLTPSKHHHVNSCLKGSRTGAAGGKGKGFGTAGHSVHILADPPCQGVKQNTDPQTTTLKQAELSETF